MGMKNVARKALERLGSVAFGFMHSRQMETLRKSKRYSTLRFNDLEKRFARQDMLLADLCKQQEDLLQYVQVGLDRQAERILQETSLRLAEQADVFARDRAAQDIALSQQNRDLSTALSERFEAMHTDAEMRQAAIEEKVSQQNRDLSTALSEGFEAMHTNAEMRQVAIEEKVERVQWGLNDHFKRLRADVPSIRGELQGRATTSTADYVLQHMRDVQSVHHKDLVHDRAIAAVTIPDGLVLEFGVYSGTTINYIADKKDWIVDGFDSFEGLPEAWRDGFDAGHFGRTELPEVRENVRLHKGWFEESLPAFLAELGSRDGPVAYLHVDCDLYSSTKTVFDNLGDRIVPGTVVVFDEYFNFDGWQDGEFLAFQEFVAARSLAYEYLTYNFKHEQAAVRIL